MPTPQITTKANDSDTSEVQLRNQSTLERMFPASPILGANPRYNVSDSTEQSQLRQALLENRIAGGELAAAGGIASVIDGAALKAQNAAQTYYNFTAVENVNLAYNPPASLDVGIHFEFAPNLHPPGALGSNGQPALTNLKGESSIAVKPNHNQTEAPLRPREAKDYLSKSAKPIIRDDYRAADPSNAKRTTIPAEPAT